MHRIINTYADFSGSSGDVNGLSGNRYFWNDHCQWRQHERGRGRGLGKRGQPALEHIGVGDNLMVGVCIGACLLSQRHGAERIIAHRFCGDIGLRVPSIGCFKPPLIGRFCLGPAAQPLKRLFDTVRKHLVVLIVFFEMRTQLHSFVRIGRLIRQPAFHLRNAVKSMNR